VILEHIASGSGDPDPFGSDNRLSRRAFLQTGAVAGGGLMLSLSLPFVNGAEAADADGFAPNAFIRIGSDGRIMLTMPYVEMGQGTYTSISMLIAEELEVDLKQVQLEHAPPNEKLYANPLLGVQATGNSNAIRGAWQPLRRAGATARTLVAAAAKRWNVDPGSCRAQSGEVLHAPTGRRVNYGVLAADAAGMPIPESVVLKQPQDFKLIGTAAKRLDTPAKVNGTAVYGIDVRPPGMMIATLAQSPVFGGRVKNVDDAAAKAVKGVRQIVRLDNAVAVVADHMGAAKKGLAALAIEWDKGPHAKLSTEEIARELEKAVLNPGPVAQNIGNVDGAMASAVARVDATYRVPFLAHATMEPMNCTVHVRKDGCEVWVGGQAIARAQATAAKTTGLPLGQVVVHNHLIGGGFGRRLDVDGVTRAVQIAMHVEGPVKVVWTREEDIQHDMYRPFWFDRFSAGLDEKGKPVAWDHRLAGSSVIARWLPPAFNNGLDPDSTEGAIDLAYALPNMHVEYLRVEPPGIPTAFWRSVGPSHNVFVTESFMDELAAAAKQDAVAYRRALSTSRPAPKPSSSLPRTRPAGDSRCPKESAVASPFSSSSGLIWRRSPKLKYRRMARFVSGASSARWIAAVSSIPIPCGRRFRARSSSASRLRSMVRSRSRTDVSSKLTSTLIECFASTRHRPSRSISSRTSRCQAGWANAGPRRSSPRSNAIFAATGRRLRKLPVDTKALKQPA
jgi:isoquinoline 1-oxidoreductase subunit beta